MNIKPPIKKFQTTSTVNAWQVKFPRKAIDYFTLPEAKQERLYGYRIVPRPHRGPSITIPVSFDGAELPAYEGDWVVEYPDGTKAVVPNSDFKAAFQEV